MGIRISKETAAAMGLENKPAAFRRHKYNAQPTTVNGIRFASKKEAACYTKLKALEDAGQIRNLLLQTALDIVVNGVHVCKYVPDFYWCEGDKQIWADAKGMKTDVYRLKKKLVKACLGIEILEL